MNYLAVFIGGGIGSLLRFFINNITKENQFFNLPLATLISNILASLILGLVVGIFISQKIENELIRNLLIVGVCGGFSTFSSFSFENYGFLQQNQFGTIFIYTSISIIVSLILIYLGIEISKWIFA